MEQHKLVGEDIKLVLKENVLAVISSNNLSVVSSAIHNGGCKKTKTIINTQVFDEYGDRRLHDDPVLFIIESSKKLGNIDDFVGMVTYASIKDFSLVSKRDGEAFPRYSERCQDDRGDCGKMQPGAGYR